MAQVGSVGNPLSHPDLPSTLTPFEAVTAAPKRNQALRPMAKSLDSGMHQQRGGLHDLFGTNAASRPAELSMPSRQRTSTVSNMLTVPAPALTGFSSSDDEDDDDENTNADGRMLVKVTSGSGLLSPPHVVQTTRGADYLRFLAAGPAVGAQPTDTAAANSTTAKRQEPQSHSPPADYSLGSHRSVDLGKAASASVVVEPTSPDGPLAPSSPDIIPGALGPQEDLSDDHFALYHPHLDEFAYFKACCAVAALRLAARVAYLLQLASLFIGQGRDIQSPAAVEIRTKVGDDPLAWPFSSTVVEALGNRVSAVRDAALDIVRHGVVGPQSAAVWNRSITALRRHSAAIPITTTGDRSASAAAAAGRNSPPICHHPQLSDVTIQWERVAACSPKRHQNVPPLHPVDDATTGEADGWSSDDDDVAEDHSIGHGAVLPPIAIQNAGLEVNDNDGWSDGGSAADDLAIQACKTVTHSNSHANFVSIQPSPTAPTPNRRWSGHAGEYIEAEMRRFSTRRETRLRCAPLPRLHLSLSSEAPDTTRSLSRSWAAESTSSFATSGHVGMDEVLPGMFCGSREPSEDLTHLEMNHVTHVVSCINTQPFADSSTVTYTVLDMTDTEDQPLGPPALIATSAIERRWLNGGENVLVHCGSGVSRAPAVSIFAVCKLFPELNSAIGGTIMRHGRPYMLMNNGFKRQLCETYPDTSQPFPGGFGSNARTPSRSSVARSGSVPNPAE